jgi:hypothetical protein
VILPQDSGLHRQEHGVDDVDDAVGLEYVGNRDPRHVAFGVGDGQVAGPRLLDPQVLASTVLRCAMRLDMVLAPKKVIAGPIDPGWMRTIVCDRRSKLRRAGAELTRS